MAASGSQQLSCGPGEPGARAVSVLGVPLVSPRTPALCNHLIISHHKHCTPSSQ